MGELVAMTNDFLDLARLEGAELELERSQVDLRALAKEVAEDFDPLCVSKEVTITWDDDDEPLFVPADRRRLNQVFSNLLSNAIKFSPPSASVRVHFVTHEDTIEAQVTDRGPGIEKAALPRLFMRYARALDANHTVAGTGLGLMIVKQLVQAHGGAVRVASEVGAGSTFAFSLPRTAPPSRSTRVPQDGREDSPPGSIHALVVDDDEDARELMAYALQTHGYYVTQAENGRVALDLLTRMRTMPAVMLLDIAMPVMSGTELLHILAERQIVPKLPVVVISAHAIDAPGARRILRKPIPIDILLEIVDDAAGRVSAPPAPPK